MFRFYYLSYFFSPPQNETCHLFSLYSYCHMLSQCSSKMRQMVRLISQCVIRDVSIPRRLCLLTWTDEETSCPRRDFPWAGFLKSCSSTYSSCVRSLLATVTRTAWAVSLCVVILWVVRPSRGGGGALILINGVLTERGHIDWICQFRAELDLFLCSVEIKLPIQAAFC